MKQETFVPITIDGTKVQFGLTKKSTCGDIIKMAASCPYNDTRFAVYEIHAGIEKRLHRNTKLLKLVRTWGLNRHDYSLEVKMTRNKNKSKMACIARAKETFNRLRSLLKSDDTAERDEVNEDNITEKYQSSKIAGNLDSNMMSMGYKQYDKNITIIRELKKASAGAERHFPVGKIELLNRYLQDSMSRNLSNDTTDENTRSGFDDNISSMMGSHVFGNNLDEAFISNVSQLENQFVTYGELNNGLLYETADGLFTDDESAFEDDSECSSLCDLERNITMEDIDATVVDINDSKSVFGNEDLNACIVEDSLFISFVNRVGDGNQSDEGWSSVGSDFE